MGELFEITYERFLKEVRRARLMPDGQNKIEAEDLGEMYALYLAPVGLNKTYVTIVEKAKVTNFERYYLNPISEPSRRVTQEMDLKNLSETLKRVEKALEMIPKTKT